MDASSDSPNSETAARLTPMMAQYFEIKAVNPGSLLFYRMGDFYELFFEDAEIASRALGIVLTKRGKHEGEDIRMCGVPVERADDYLNRLIALGHRVAVCEQMEDPAAGHARHDHRGTAARARPRAPFGSRPKGAFERGTAGLRARGA
jgi:DNA mismatch repair protein MutS